MSDLHPQEAATSPATMGLRLMPEQQEHLIRTLAYDHLDEFIRSRCQKPEFSGWLARNQSCRPLWDTLWSKVRGLAARDRDLILLVAAACACEGIPLPSEDLVIANLRQYEDEIKRFLAERGYFAVSAFEVPGQAALRPG